MKPAIFSIITASIIFTTQHSSAAPAPSCPQGLTYIGTAYKEANAEPGHEAKVTAMPPFLIMFPRNFRLDKSYRMRGGRWAGGSAGAVANDGDVPNGLYVMGSGTEGGAKGWSIGAPVMKVIDEDDDGKITQRGYTIPLYCHTGSGVADQLGHVSCNVSAVFCAKEMK